MVEKKNFDRRKFMELGIVVIGGAIFTVSGAAMARFAIGTSFDELEEVWIELDEAEIPNDGEGMYSFVLEFTRKDGYMSHHEKKLIYAKKTKTGEVIALSAVCTHLACIVSWSEEQQLFLCPCHTGIYDSDGMVVSGPPPRPLGRHKVKIEDGQLYVSSQIDTGGGDSHA